MSPEVTVGKSASMRVEGSSRRRDEGEEVCGVVVTGGAGWDGERR